MMSPIGRPQRTSTNRAERRISDEAANSGGLDLATIHRLSRNALNDEATEFS